MFMYMYPFICVAKCANMCMPSQLCGFMVGYTEVKYIGKLAVPI